MELLLFKKDMCPFCNLVEDFIEANNLEDKVEYRDIVKDPENMEYLMENGGRNMVPCLFIDGYPMYESEDIIAWLDENLVK